MSETRRRLSIGGRATILFVAVVAAALLSSLNPYGTSGIGPLMSPDEEGERSFIFGVGGENYRDGAAGSARNLRRDRQHGSTNQKKKKSLVKYKEGSGEHLIRSWRRKRASSSTVRDFKRGSVALIEIDEEEENDILYDLEEDDDVEFVEEVRLLH